MQPSTVQMTVAARHTGLSTTLVMALGDAFIKCQ